MEEKVYPYDMTHEQVAKLTTLGDITQKKTIDLKSVDADVVVIPTSFGDIPIRKGKNYTRIFFQSKGESEGVWVSGISYGMHSTFSIEPTYFIDLVYKDGSTMFICVFQPEDGEWTCLLSKGKAKQAQ